jgi:tetratricopeptide (TPR) repeat protein
MSVFDLASLTGDLKDLQWLILGVLGFVLALVYRPQLTAIAKRLTDYKVQHGDTSMEAALTPTEQTTETAAEEVGSVSEEPPPDEPKSDHSEDRETSITGPHDEPKHVSVAVLRRQMVETIRAREDEKAQKIFDQLQSREENPVTRKEDRALWLYLRFTEGMEPDALEQLEELAKDSDVAARALAMKGLCYRFAGNPKAAVTELRRAREAAPNDSYAVTVTSSLIEALNAAGDYDDAIGEAEEGIRQTEAPELRSRLWVALAGIYETHNEHELRALALQQSLEHSPDARSRRFNTAYAYSEADHDMFAPVMAHHYQTVIRFDPDHVGARNNLAVVFDRKDLDILAVEEYRVASEGGNTLAAANLAYQYLNAGFTNEAEELVTKAQEAESAHPNVGEAASAITNNRNQQEGDRQELYATGQRQAAFLSRYAEARIRVPIVDLGGKWRFPDGYVAEVTVGEDDQIIGEWMAGNVKWKFAGQTYGASAKVKVSEMEYSKWLSKREERGFTTRGDAFAYLSGDGQSLELMKVKGGITFLSLRRVKESAAESA